MKAPSFWSHKGILSSALLPLSAFYQMLSFMRGQITTPYRSKLCVVCVGNITSGGTGKTPVTAFLARQLTDQGMRVAILSRGYGGTQKTPLKIEPAHHLAAQVGDEPLLLAHFADVIVSPNRAAGAKFIEQLDSYDVILMDDGMQNPQLEKDVRILIFDGALGLQNNRILPAGPLRQTLSSALPSADVIMINGPDKTALRDQLGNQPCFGFTLAPDAPSQADISGSPVFAFAGIGRPERFFETLREHGYQLGGTKAYGDHHSYQKSELDDLWQQADRLGARLITTQKDWVRLPKEWQEKIAYLPVRLQISDKDVTVMLSMITQHLA